MIVASWNPELGAVSMLSIPRDLYVKILLVEPLGLMQYLLSFMVVQKVFQRLDQVLQENSKKLLVLDIPYYATIDFGGFKGDC